MLFLITCNDCADGPAIRAKTLPLHQAHLPTVQRWIKAAGPLMGADGKPCGSFFLVEAESEADARAFMARDPFHQAGLWATIQVQACRATFGDWFGGRPAAS